MTGLEIINKFELWTDDQTELSTDEELFLANEKAKEIYGESVWEFLRKNVTGNFINGEIDLATVAPDFIFMMANYSDDTTSYLTPTNPVVFVGGRPYRVIPMGMKKQFENQDACYVDIAAKKIKFTNPTLAGTFDFDYQYMPEDFTETTSPPLPVSHLIIVYAMLVDDDIIQKTDKGRSNVKENMTKYVTLMSNLKSYNAKFMLQ